MLVIVDYGMGNLHSVQKAFELCGARPKTTGEPADVLKADKIVLPGVGAFGEAMRELKKRGLLGALKEKIKSGTPYLGLCLGLQLLFERSEEGDCRGLGVVPGQVKRFQGSFKIPHMGWNTLTADKNNNALLKGVAKDDFFYFVHSYYAEPADRSWVAATTPYGKEFCSVLSKGSLFATQFHPEKSQKAGLKIIRNFILYKGDTR